jgi:hypothetical protein
MWDLLAPSSFDVKVGERLLQIGREQGEFIVFHLMLERLWTSAANVRPRLLGLRTADLMVYVDRLPEGVIRDYRRKRQYLSSMLAKNEVNSTSPYGRKLFERRAHGLYSFNPALALWVEAASEEGRWVPAEEVIGMPLRLLPVRLLAEALKRP